MKKLLALILALIMCFSLVACGGGKKAEEKPAEESKQPAASQGAVSKPEEVAPADPEKEYKKEFIIANSMNFSAWDPVRDTSANYIWMYNLVYDSLLFQDLETGEYLPRLATEWEFSEKNTVLTLKLRNDAYFSNGEQFDADDVVFTLERMHAFPDKTVPKMFADVEKVEVVDQFTVKYILKNPNPDFLCTLAQPYNVMMNRDAFSKDPATGEYDWEWPEVNTTRIEDGNNGRLIGTGLYVYEDFVDNDYASVVKRTDGKYWGEDNPTERFIFRTIPEASARLLALEAGEVDYVFSVSADDKAFVEDNDDLVLVSGGRTGIHYMAFNYSNGAAGAPYGDQNFRLAFTKALNREELSLAMYAGLAKPAYSNYSQYQFGYASQEQVHGYDPEAAKEYLAKSSYKGEEIVIATTPSYKNMALTMCDQLRKIGINASVRDENATTIWTTLKNEEQDAHIYNINMNPNGDDLRRFLTTSGGIPAIDVNPLKDQLWELFDKALATEGDAEREEIYAEIQRLVAEDCYLLPLIVPGAIDAQSANVEGTYWRANTVFDFRQARAVVD